MSGQLLGALGIFACASVAFLVFFIWSRHRKRVLGEIAKAAGGKVSGQEVVAVKEGRVYRLRYGEGNRDQEKGEGIWPTMTVTVDASSDGIFEVVEETDSDESFKKLVVSAEVQIGDPEFDYDFYILSPTEKFARAYFGSAENRHAVRELFRQGFGSLRHDGRSLSARLSLDFLDGFLGPMNDRSVAALNVRLSAAYSSLGILARNLRNMPAPALRESTHRWRFIRTTVFLIPALALLAAICLEPTGASRFDPLLDGNALIAYFRILGSVAAAIFIALAALLLRAFSRMEFWVVCLMAIIIFPVSFPFLAEWANIRLDSRQAATHELLVIGKEAREGRYRLWVESWRKPDEHETITVDRALFYGITPRQDRLAVSTKPGYLDYEWVVSYSVSYLVPAESGAKESAAGVRANGPAPVRRVDPHTPGPPAADAEAMADLKRRIESNPRDFDSHLKLDRILTRHRSWDELISYWNSYIEIVPDNAEAYFERAGTFLMKGDPRSAVSDLDKACGLGHQRACEIRRSHYGQQ